MHKTSSVFKLARNLRKNFSLREKSTQVWTGLQAFLCELCGISKIAISNFVGITVQSVFSDFRQLESLSSHKWTKNNSFFAIVSGLGGWIRSVKLCPEFAGFRPRTGSLCSKWMQQSGWMTHRLPAEMISQFKSIFILPLPFELCGVVFAMLRWEIFCLFEKARVLKHPHFERCVFDCWNFEGKNIFSVQLHIAHHSRLFGSSSCNIQYFVPGFCWPFTQKPAKRLSISGLKIFCVPQQTQVNRSRPFPESRSKFPTTQQKFHKSHIFQQISHKLQFSANFPQTAVFSHCYPKSSRYFRCVSPWPKTLRSRLVGEFVLQTNLSLPFLLFRFHYLLPPISPPPNGTVYPGRFRMGNSSSVPVAPI